MALKGTFYGTTSNDNIQPKIVWSATQSVSGNYSTVTATLYYSRTNTGYTTKGTGSFSLTINGKKATASKYVTLTYNSNTMAITHKVQVSHSANGTKSITISATGSISGTTMTSTTISSTVNLDAIARATTPELDKTSANVGDTVVISLPRGSSSFTHDLEYKFASSGWIGFATGVGTSYSWKLPDLSARIPEASNGVLSIRCTTKSGGTSIGSKTISMTLRVPYTDEYYPIITSVTVADSSTAVAAQFGSLIQNKSKLKVTISAKGAGGSSIKSYSTTIQGKTYTGSSFTTDVITTKGSLSFTTEVVDSRNRSYRHKTTVNVLAYSPPKITSFLVTRTDGTGKPDSEGSDAVILFNYEMPTLKADSSYKGNTASAKIEYKLSVDPDTAWKTLWSDNELWVVGVYYTHEQTNTKGILSIDNQFDIRITVTDYFGASSSARAVLPSGVVIVDIKANGKGLGIGKTAELDDTVETDWHLKINDGLSGLGTNILWDSRSETIPGNNMGTTTTVSLAEKISDQTMGAVFSWCKYTTTNGYHNWRHFFVPKAHVLHHAGTGVYMNDPYLGMRKYIYISDQSMKGHANNAGTGTANGIAYDNADIKLMYVVGI